jgi:cell division protein FtsB
VGLILSALAFIAEAEDRKKKHRLTFVALIVVLGVLSLISTHLQQKKSEKDQTGLQAENGVLKAKLESIQNTASALRGQVSNLEEELAKNKVLHPAPEPPIKIVSTVLDPTLEEGQPRTLRLTVQNTTGSLISIVPRKAVAYVPLRGDFSSYTDDERTYVEDAAYADLLGSPFGPDQEFSTANGAMLDITNYTPGLTAEQVQALRSGKALIYYLFQINSKETNETLMLSCVFVTPRGEVLDCRHHHKP